MIGKRLFTWIPVSLSLMLLALIVGCGRNVADTQTATEPVTAQPTPVAIEEPDQETERERERELAQRVQQLEARLVDIEAGNEAEAAVEPEPRVAQVPVEPVPQPAPEPVVRTVTVTLPATTRIEVELLNAISSEESLAGDPVRAVVVQDVMQDGMLAIPADSVVSGAVVESVPAKKIGGRARVVVDFDTLRLHAGDSVPIRSSVEFSGKKQSGKDAATIGGSAAGGAILGRVLSKGDRDKGTIIGAVVGAAIGTAVASNNKADPVLVEGGETTELLLETPLTLTLTDPIPTGIYASHR